LNIEPTQKLGGSPKKAASASNQLITVLTTNLIKKLEEEPEVRVSFLHLIIVNTTKPYHGILGKKEVRDYLTDLKREIGDIYKEYKKSWKDQYFTEFKIVRVRKKRKYPWNTRVSREAVSELKKTVRTAVKIRTSMRAQALILRLSQLQNNYQGKSGK
jgi:hypothetical protein